MRISNFAKYLRDLLRIHLCIIREPFTQPLFLIEAY
nr:MAG TPA: Type II site-specific deoxyribonuclease [Caudoviricetes sp.]